MNGFATSFLPLKRYADFTGRSTRFELLLFYVLLIVLNIAIGYAGVFIGPETSAWGQRGLLLLAVCPILALMVRRLHDSGRSSWWLLIGLPLLGFRLWEEYLRFNGPLALSPIDELPLLARLALALTGLALVVFLLWNDQPQANRYGPNPRYGETSPQLP